MRAEGVDTVFGYPEGAVIPLFDALYRDGGFNVYRLPATSRVETMLQTDMQELPGEVGVMIATSGPGATNTVTGIATAFSDSVPLVVISGQVGSSLLGKNSSKKLISYRLRCRLQNIIFSGNGSERYRTGYTTSFFIRLVPADRDRYLWILL